MAGTLNEAFSGDQQQDSQEFVTFLIDGLHEDMNLRKTKPYIENPDSENRNVTDLGFESFSNSLKRDWSFITFMFNGQNQSSLECLTCNKISITFDVLSIIPLALPEPKEYSLNIIVHPLPNKIKQLLNLDSRMIKKKEKSSSKKQKKVTSDQPMHIFLKINKDASVVDLIDRITDIKDVGFQKFQEKTEIVLY